MAELIIRRAEVRDTDAIHEIEQACFPDPWSRESIRAELADNPDAYYLAAEIDGLVAGYAGLWRILDEGHITNVAVRPECRRQGIGARIIGTLLAQTRQLGIRHHTLEVRESNLPALALYEGFGFTSAGIRPGYYSSGHENAVIMWRHDPEIETENEDSGNNI